MSAPSPVRWVSRLAAALGPLGVVAAVGGVLLAQGPADARSWRNAGYVLNGRRVERPVAEHIDQRVAERPPRVVVLGNSNAHTDLEARLLAERLGVDPADVLVLSVPLSVGAHWYAMLERRLFDAGVAPELVVVVSRLQLMLWTQPLSEAGWVNLEAHLEPPLDEVTRRTGASDSRLAARLRAGRHHARAGLRTALRRQALAWLGPAGGEGARRLDEALDDGLLAPVHLDRAPPTLPSLEQGYLPVLAARVRDHGGRLVLARPPVAPHVDPGAADVVPEATLAAVEAWAASTPGVDWIDLASLEVPQELWKNPTHLGPAGARAFTASLGAQLDARARPGRWAVAVGLDAALQPVVPRVEALTAPPRVVQGDLAVEGRWGRFPSGELAAVADPRVAADHPRGARCSPVVVDWRGVTLPRTTCHALPRWPVPAVCHEGEQVVVHTPERALHQGEVPRLALSPERRCAGAVWAYPGDRLRLRWPDGAVLGGATALVLDLAPRGQRGTVQVRLTVDGASWLDEAVATEAWPGGAVRWAIPEVPLGAEVVLELACDQDFVLLTQAALVAP